MKHHLLLLASMLVAGCGFTATEDGPRENPADISPCGQVPSPRDLAKRVGAMVSAASAQELESRMADADDGMALSAGWERVRRTMPEKEQQEALRPDRETIARFLGLVEGRTRFPIPAIWETAMKSLQYLSRKQFWFYLPQVLEGAANAEGESASGVAIRREGDQWTITKANQTISLSTTDRFGSGGKAAVELKGETAYVALYGRFPFSYKLYAVDRRSGKVIWVSRVWAGSGFGLRMGQDWHVVEIRVAGGKVAVFGVSSDTAYVEMFDQKTGENQCRFGTEYFRAVVVHRN